jgi:4'-phosphopantetheinyl transferase
LNGVSSPAAPHRLPAAPGFDAVQLWRIDLHGEATAQDAALLSHEEQHRAARFAFDHLRHRYVLAHAALRRLLGQAMGRDPAALVWQLGAQGKPSLHDGWFFNMSHSGDVGLVALSAQHEIGIDVELNQKPHDAVELSKAVLTSSERTWMLAGGPADVDRRFLCCWTRKEACIKAIGSGLSLAPQTFDAGAGDTRTTLKLTWAQRAWPVTVMPMAAGDDVIAALALISR